MHGGDRRSFYRYLKRSVGYPELSCTCLNRICRILLYLFYIRYIRDNFAAYDNEVQGNNSRPAVDKGSSITSSDSDTDSLGPILYRDDDDPTQQQHQQRPPPPSYPTQEQDEEEVTSEAKMIESAVDNIARVVFPITFILFNLIFWLYYNR